jgi:myo-inositol-1(or 4)-monophosphatase
LAYVAAGRLEGYYEFNLKVWDVAAGILLVQEAGGKVTDFSGGNNYRYGQEVLAAGGVHEEMRKVIARHWF